MPEVETQLGTKRFPYSKKGKKKAREYVKKSGGELSYGIGNLKKK